MRSGRGRQLVAGLVATGLLLSACSKDKDDAKAGTSIIQDDTTTTTDAVYTGDAHSAFCSLLKDLDTTSVFAPNDHTPSVLEANFGKLLDVLAEAADRAPKVIKSDVKQVLDGVQAYVLALDAVDYDLDKLAKAPNALEVSALLADPDFQVAGTRITAYKTQVCHL